MPILNSKASSCPLDIATWICEEHLRSDIFKDQGLIVRFSLIPHLFLIQSSAAPSCAEHGPSPEVSVYFIQP